MESLLEKTISKEKDRKRMILFLEFLYRSPLSEESLFTERLEMDSMEKWNFYRIVKKKLNIEIPWKKARKLNNINDYLDYFENNLGRYNQ